MIPMTDTGIKNRIFVMVRLGTVEMFIEVTGFLGFTQTGPVCDITSKL
jgi:hypothetical protein